jgi:hypothetical protein
MILVSPTQYSKMSGTYKNPQPLPAIPQHLLPTKKHHLRTMAAYIAQKYVAHGDWTLRRTNLEPLSPSPEADVDIRMASISSARVSTPISVTSSQSIGKFTSFI